MVGVGPVAGTYIGCFEDMPAEQRPNLWVVGELPLEQNLIPEELLTKLDLSARLVVVEEHVRQGSFASQLLLSLAERGCAPKRFTHLCARAHITVATVPRHFCERSPDSTHNDVVRAGERLRMDSLESNIRALKGPILVTGASGFVGANLFKKLYERA